MAKAVRLWGSCECVFFLWEYLVCVCVCVHVFACGPECWGVSAGLFSEIIDKNILFPRERETVRFFFPNDVTQPTPKRTNLYFKVWLQQPHSYQVMCNFLDGRKRICSPKWQIFTQSWNKNWSIDPSGLRLTFSIYAFPCCIFKVGCFKFSHFFTE